MDISAAIAYNSKWKGSMSRNCDIGNTNSTWGNVEIKVEKNAKGYPLFEIR